jgi:hypothetical protein
MKICINCGARQNDTMIFCNQCNEKLEKPISEEDKEVIEKQIEKTLENLYKKPYKPINIIIELFVLLFYCIVFYLNFSALSIRMVSLKLYIVPIAIIIVFIIFKLHQKFILCNLFIFPVFFTLLPFLVYLNEPAYGWFAHFGSVLVGMIYAFPMTIITLSVAVFNFNICYKPGNKAKTVFAVGGLIIVALTWFTYFFYIWQTRKK